MAVTLGRGCVYADVSHGETAHPVRVSRPVNATQPPRDITGTVPTTPGGPNITGGSSHNNLVILGPNMTQGPATTSPSGLYHNNLMILGPTSPMVLATTSPRSSHITQGAGHNNLMMLGPYITHGPSHNITQGSQPQHHPGVPATTSPKVKPHHPGCWPQQSYDAGTLHHPRSQPQHHPGVPTTTSPRVLATTSPRVLALQP